MVANNDTAILHGQLLSNIPKLAWCKGMIFTTANVRKNLILIILVMATHTTTHYGSGAFEHEATPHAGVAVFKRISWGSIFAGALIALVVQLALSLLGFGIGMGTVNPMEESQPMAGLGTGSLIWWAVSMLISLFIGGWVAGRLAGIPRNSDSILHGLLTWSLVTLLYFYLLTTAVGRIIGGVGSVIGKTVSLAGQGLSAAAPEIGEAVQSQIGQQNIDLSNLKSEARLILQQTGKPELQPENLANNAKQAGNEVKQQMGSAASNPQAMGENADNVIDQLFAKGGNIAQEVDKEAVVNVIMQRSGKSREEANQIADNWIQTFQQSKAKFQQTTEEAKMKAQKVADDAASAVSKAGIFAFIGLVLGAAAAGFGGKVGRPDDIVV
jgi:ElaB/YqjD/DUF883 family membrane-anchored ribosome-binding protein